ncbi:acyltransferase domain-containing protein [Tsukamurella soli]|uniref:acyltransferase domain-containing protein n=1 Tax=Tsukamurella soli TaxID=644556 RepID=UPI0036118425
MNAPVFPDGTVGFALSADSEELLAHGARDLLRYLDAHAGVAIEDVAAALVAVRETRRHRALVRARDRAGLRAALAELGEALGRGNLPEGVRIHRGTPGSGRPAFVYPGQGSQRPGMGALYYRLSDVYRGSIDRSHERSLALFDASPRDYLLAEGDYAPDDDAAGGSASVRIDAPVDVVQPAIFMQMLGMVAMWNAAGVHADIHLGHSQGEIAAAVAAGAISLDDGLRVVTGRARLVRDLSPEGYAMAVLGIDREATAAIIARRSGFVEHSVVNSAHIQCISGSQGEVHAVVEQLTEAGTFAREIRVAYPAHTSIVGMIAADRVAYLADNDSTTFLDTGDLCIGGTLGGPITSDISPVDYWYLNLRNPVRFDLATAAALEAGADVLIEVSEHPTLQLALLENISEARGAVRRPG